ncbi:MAG: acetyltransferase [Coriobacteriia bacterium]|nr:acetyltransferase [Coriobacteriia bacterium]MCL2746633.1 acetyltransferase [Coriobacteriia bacterium]MCL2870980.1 acetyltransferase [Coriobacteriia bacterium]
MTVRSLLPSDRTLLRKWMNDGRVLEWYEGRDRHFTEEMISEEFYTDWEDEVIRTIIEIDDTPIGYGQVYRLYDDLYKAYEYENKGETVYGMDQFIGEPEYWGKGIGTEYLRLLFEYLMNAKSADAIITDPLTTNKRAIRAYEKAGFVKLYIVKEHEMHEGKLRDSWIMEYRGNRA